MFAADQFSSSSSLALRKFFKSTVETFEVTNIGGVVFNETHSGIH